MRVSFWAHREAIIATLLKREEFIAGGGLVGVTGPPPPEAKFSLDDKSVVLNKCLTRFKEGRASLVALSVRRGKKSRKWTVVEAKKAKPVDDERGDDDDADGADGAVGGAVADAAPGGGALVAARKKTARETLLAKALERVDKIVIRLTKQRGMSDAPASQPMPRSVRLAQTMLELEFRNRLKGDTGKDGRGGRVAVAHGPDASMWFSRMERCVLKGAVVLTTAAERSQFFPDTGAAAVPGGGDEDDKADPTAADAGGGKKDKKDKDKDTDKGKDKKDEAAEAAAAAEKERTEKEKKEKEEREKKEVAAVAAPPGGGGSALAAAPVFRPGDSLTINAHALEEGTLKLSGSRYHKAAMGVFVRVIETHDGAAVWRRDGQRDGAPPTYLYRSASLDGRWCIGPGPGSPACQAHSLGGDVFGSSWKEWDTEAREWVLVSSWKIAHQQSADEWGGLTASSLGGAVVVAAAIASADDNAAEVWFGGMPGAPPSEFRKMRLPRLALTPIDITLALFPPEKPKPALKKDGEDGKDGEGKDAGEDGEDADKPKKGKKGKKKGPKHREPDSSDDDRSYDEDYERDSSDYGGSDDDDDSDEGTDIEEESSDDDDDDGEGGKDEEYDDGVDLMEDGDGDDDEGDNGDALIEKGAEADQWGALVGHLFNEDGKNVMAHLFDETTLRDGRPSYGTTCTAELLGVQASSNVLLLIPAQSSNTPPDHADANALSLLFRRAV